MKRSLAVVAAVLAIATAAPAFAGAAAPALGDPSKLSATQAAAVLSAAAIGEQLPAGLSLELAKFFRDNSSGSRQARQNMSTLESVYLQDLLNTALEGVGAPNLQDLGISIPVNPAIPPSIKDVWDTYGLVKTVAFVVAAYGTPDLGEWYLPHNTRSVGSYTKTKTTPLPAVGAFFLSATCQTRNPAGICTAVTAASGVAATKGITAGYIWTVSSLLDVDTLVTTALDSNIVTDLILTQVPISTTVGTMKTCLESFVFPSGINAGKSVCITDNGPAGQPFTIQNDKALATNATYTFAYPLSAGEFATRLTAQDAVQTAYDALGKVWTQKPRDPLAASPFADIAGLEALVPGTGLADLTTQAPPVNFFGIQAPPGSLAQQLNAGLVSPLLNAIGRGQLQYREHTPAPLTVDVAALTNLTPVTGSLPISVDDWITGPTVGYRANEVRSSKINIMVVRWHNVGTSTVGGLVDNLAVQANLTGLPSIAATLPSAPATIYYDVPAGEYTLTDSAASAPRDAEGAVFSLDWTVAAPPPPVVLPPTLPNLNALPTTLNGIMSHLGLGAPF